MISVRYGVTGWSGTSSSVFFYGSRSFVSRRRSLLIGGSLRIQFAGFDNGPLFLAFEHADLVFELNDLLLLKLHRFDELRNDTEQLLNQRSLFRLRDIRQSQFHWRRT